MWCANSYRATIEFLSLIISMNMQNSDDDDDCDGDDCDDDDNDDDDDDDDDLMMIMMMIMMSLLSTGFFTKSGEFRLTEVGRVG